MASRYYNRARESYPQNEELWLEPPSNPFRARDEERLAIFDPVLAFPQHDGDGEFTRYVDRRYPSPTTDSTRYSMSSSLLNSVASGSARQGRPAAHSRQESAQTASSESWQDVGTLSLTASRDTAAEPSAEVWHWSITSGHRTGDESDWIPASLNSSFSLLSPSPSYPSQLESLDMSIDSEQWRRVQARSRVISSSQHSRAEAEAFLHRRRQMDAAGPIKETFWEALLRRLLMLDGATLRLIKGEEGGSLFFDGKEAPLAIEPAPTDIPKPPEQRALTTFLSHVASSLSPSAALKRGLAVLPLSSSQPPPSAAASPKQSPDDVKTTQHWMATTAGGVAWYVLAALPLIISLEAGGRVWRVWKMSPPNKERS